MFEPPHRLAVTSSGGLRRHDHDDEIDITFRRLRRHAGDQIVQTSFPTEECATSSAPSGGWVRSISRDLPGAFTPPDRASSSEVAVCGGAGNRPSHLPSEVSFRSRCRSPIFRLVGRFAGIVNLVVQRLEHLSCDQVGAILITRPDADLPKNASCRRRPSHDVGGHQYDG